MNSRTEINVAWKNKLHKINVKYEDSVFDLKYYIYKATGLKPSRLLLSEMSLPGNIKENDCKLRDLNLTADGALTIESRCDTTQRRSSFKLNVEFQSTVFQIYIEEEDTFTDLKCLIYDLTNVKPLRQSLVNLGLSETTDDEDRILRRLHFNTEFTLKVIDKFSQCIESSWKKLKVEWNQIHFKIGTEKTERVSDLKSRIFVATGVKPVDQNLLNLPLSGNVDGYSYLLGQMNLKSGFILRVAHRFRRLSTKTANQIEPPIDSFHKLIYIEIQPVSSFGNDNSKAEELGCRILSQPRPGKKLVILDVDKTVFDYKSSDVFLGTRPFLHTFLEQVYEHYDIGFWSATKTDVLEWKLNILGVLGSSRYKILFYMDIRAMASVWIVNKRSMVKPLRNVWEIYREFNYHNTIICDDREVNFYLNPRNGIPILPYFYQNHAWDNELLRLLSYLKYIGQEEDLTVMDHKQWRTYGCWDSDSSEDNENPIVDEVKV